MDRHRAGLLAIAWSGAAALFGFSSATAQTAEEFFRNARNVTLVVSRMLGLRNTASMTSVVNGSPASTGANWLGNSFADAEGHIWRELSLSRLIATPDFLMVGR